MNYALFLGALLLGLVAYTHAECKGRPTSQQCMHNGHYLVNKTECEDQECCWRGKECFTSFSRTGVKLEKSSKSPGTDSLFKEVVSAAAEATAKANKRFLTFPGSNCLPPPLEFPWSCSPSVNEPYVFESPVKVPYCVRITCSLDKYEQKALDYNHTLCILQPGCYFDADLAEIRTGYPNTLSGTPVCHFAIRSPIFHKYAEKVRLAFGRWNPYYTNCLLKNYEDEIREGPPGCKLIPLLEAFNIEPKMAGWGHITPTSCSNIGGCWRGGRGCFYPVDINSVKVKSGQRFKYEPTEIQFGRPKCQHFDTSSAYTKLQSYHKCLRSGCAVDSYISSNYDHYLYELGSGFSVDNQYKYWDAAKAGHYGAYNVELISSQYKDPSPSRSVGFGFSNLFPLSPSTGITPTSRHCGLRIFPNSRPCAPKTLPNPIFHYKCPYKDVYYPRFPTLKGSFKGCCDINLCYLPREDIRKMQSGAATYMLHWTAWSACSVQFGGCGVGTQTRKRDCISTKRAKCTSGSYSERKSCHKKCVGWGNWSSWPSCPESCAPGGVITRKRLCLPIGSHCAPDVNGTEGEEVMNCNTHRCPPRG